MKQKRWFYFPIHLKGKADNERNLILRLCLSQSLKNSKKLENQIANIRNEAIDGDGIALFRIHFERGKLKLKVFAKNELPDSIYTDLVNLESELEVALQIAHSRFRLKNRGVLARFFGGAIDKIPKK
jgi:hypothetical protein